MNNPKYCQKCGYVDLSGIENECPFCEKETLETEETYDELKKTVDNLSEIKEYIRQLYVYFSNDFDESLQITREEIFPDEVICPKCGSRQIQITQRGWTLATGFIGSGKTERVCVNCMCKF